MRELIHLVQGKFLDTRTICVCLCDNCDNCSTYWINLEFYIAETPIAINIQIYLPYLIFSKNSGKA